jgi:hypothetical protein
MEAAGGIVTREHCKNCGRISAVGFHVPDDIWAGVVPEHLRERVLCIACFAMFGDESLTLWDAKIDFYPVPLARHLMETT